MATKNITFTSLKLKTNEVESKKIEVGEKEIEVKQYLPINDKLNLIAEVLVNSADANNFANPVKIDAVSGIEIVKAYTNITFTDKQLEDIAKLYDVLETNDIINKVIAEIPEKEIAQVYDGIESTSKAYYEWSNSLKGIITSIGNSYDETNMNLTELTEKIQNPENLKFLKDVMDKLG